MARNFSNISPRLALVGAINSSVTAITVDGDPVVTADFTAVLSASPDKSGEEIVLVTASVQNGVNWDLTVTRGYEGTTAKSHAAGVAFEHCVVAGDIGGSAGGSAASPVEVAMLARPAASAVVTITKSLFIPVTAGGTTSVFPYNYQVGNDTIANFLSYLSNANAPVAFQFIVPSDYNTLLTADVIVVPDTTETIQWDQYVTYFGEDVSYLTNFASHLNLTKSVVSNVHTRLDASPFLRNKLAAKDMINYTFISNTSSIRVFGLSLTYQ